MSDRIVGPEEVGARIADGGCVLRAGELLNVAAVRDEDLARCSFESGSGFYIAVVEPEDDSPPPRRHTHPKDKTLSPPDTVADAVPAVAPDQLLPLLPADAGIPSVQALMEAPANLQAVLPKAADTNGFTVLMGVVAVAGGGAAWKFYDSHSKRKHAENMARIERGNDDQHATCKAERAALESKLGEVQSKLESALSRLDAVAAGLEQQREKTSIDLSDFDPEELEDRLKKLEKAITKPTQKKGKA